MFPSRKRASKPSCFKRAIRSVRLIAASFLLTEALGHFADGQVNAIHNRNRVLPGETEEQPIFEGGFEFFAAILKCCSLSPYASQVRNGSVEALAISQQLIVSSPQCDGDVPIDHNSFTIDESLRGSCAGPGGRGRRPMGKLAVLSQSNRDRLARR